jgi:hypothetical protein
MCKDVDRVVDELLQEDSSNDLLDFFYKIFSFPIRYSDKE